MNADLALRLTACLVAGRSLLNGLEMLYEWQSYCPSGLFGWPARQEQRAWTREGPLQRVSTVFLDGQVYRLLLWLQLLAAVWVIATPRTAPAPLFLLLCLEVLSDLRNAAFGRDGSDRIHLVVLVALTLTVSSQDAGVRCFGVLFIALQALVAYFTSGAIKLLSPAWRDGRAMITVLRSENYGVPWASAFLAAHPRIGRWAGRGVIAFELSLPFVCLLGPKVTAVGLALALCFHLGIAATMGLNSFVWSFGATYPAIYCMSIWAQSAVVRMRASM